MVQLWKVRGLPFATLKCTRRPILTHKCGPKLLLPGSFKVHLIYIGTGITKRKKLYITFFKNVLPLLVMSY